MSEHGHSKADVEHWDTVMSENIGEDKSSNQPLKWREGIHTGKSEIKQAHGQAPLVKQHPENKLAVKIGKEREQHMAAEDNFRREELEANPASSSSQWDGWWWSSWWDNTSWKWTER